MQPNALLVRQNFIVVKSGCYILVLIIGEVRYRCISGYPFILVLSLVLSCIIILFLHLLSINHMCTQPCYFPLLLKLAA
jgi:hypothetical protein